MAKLDDYDLTKPGQGAEDFKDSVRDILNNGKYQITVTTTDPPSWASNPGEMVLTLAGGSANFYVAWSANVLGTSSNWVRIARAAT